MVSGLPFLANSDLFRPFLLPFFFPEGSVREENGLLSSGTPEVA